MKKTSENQLNSLKPVATKAASYDQSHEIKKLALFVTIVNFGQSEAIVNLMKHYKVSAQFIQVGEGTATSTVYDVLGILDSRKEVVLSIVRKEEAPDIRNEIESFFLMDKVNKGIAFSIPMTSIIGVGAYKFLSNT